MLSGLEGASLDDGCSDGLEEEAADVGTLAVDVVPAWDDVLDVLVVDGAAELDVVDFPPDAVLDVLVVVDSVPASSSLSDA